MTQPRVIAVDVDGTLVARGRALDPQLRTALADLNADGWSIVLATGRRLHQLGEILTQVPAEGVISSEGATIRWRDTTVHESYLPAPQWRSAVSLAERIGVTPILCTEEGSYIARQSADVDYAASYADLAPTYCPVESWMSVRPSLLMLVSADGKVTHRVAQRVAVECAVSASLSAPGFISVTAPGVDKGFALRWLLNARLEGAQVVVAGDSLNDLTLLQCAGHRIVMPTAPAEVLAVADAIADPIDQGGLIRCLTEACK